VLFSACSWSAFSVVHQYTKPACGNVQRLNLALQLLTNIFTAPIRHYCHISLNLHPMTIAAPIIAASKPIAETLNHLVSLNLAQMVVEGAILRRLPL
jgi:hypothetical protein